MFYVIFIIYILLVLFTAYRFIKENPFKDFFHDLEKEFDYTPDKKIIKNYKNSQGTIDGKKVKITNEKNKFLNIHIYHELDFEGGFSITKETFSSKFKKVSGKDDIQTCDLLFDEEMELTAKHEINLIALLNRKTREDILYLAMEANHLEITEKGINIKIPAINITEKKNVKNIIKTAISVSDDMSQKNIVKQRLMENTRENQIKEVRLNNLNLLILNYGKQKDVLVFLKKLLENEDSSVQASAAKALKKEGMDHLIKMLKNQHKENYISNPEIIGCLGDKKYTEALPLFKKIYNETRSDEIKISILTAMKNFSDPSLNDFIVKELKNDNENLRDEAIKALASCGKREAVEPLLKLDNSVFNPALKNMIQETISKIQSRLGPADLGALSIAEHSEKDGALSISDEAEKGGLSLTNEGKKDKEKKLSQDSGT